MSVLHISGIEVQVDVAEELSQYEWGPNAKWQSDKLIARSPFRYDRSPSFFVRLDEHGDYPAGTWADSGHYDSEWASGNIVKLLSFLRNETYEETEEYLLAAYGTPADGAEIKLKPIRLRAQRVRQSLSDGMLAPYAEDYAYLKGRGISEDVQRQAGVLYDAQSKAAVIPWWLGDGRLANVKYRKTRGKVFFYAKGAWPIRELVYGLELAESLTVLCEAEIDALSFRQAGYAAIAVGGASFNEWKRDAILRSPIERLVIATDNDKAGEKLRAEVERSLSGKLRLSHARIGGGISAGGSFGWKDANEALVAGGVDALREAVENAVSCRSISVKLRT